MKKIIDARSLLGVDKNADLNQLRTVYRNMMKDWHPDKFQSDASEKTEAEEKSKHIIEAYHFLVSIAPETAANALPQYLETINTATLADFSYKSQTLKVEFSDGSAYEYYDVPKATYTKLVNADSPGRFARRHIFQLFVYRNVSKVTPA